MRRLSSNKMSAKYTNVHITQYTDNILNSIKSGASSLGVNYTKTMILTDILQHIYSIYMGSVRDYDMLMAMYGDLKTSSSIVNKVRLHEDDVFIYNSLFHEVAIDTHMSCVMDVYIMDTINKNISLVVIDNREYTIGELIGIGDNLKTE